MKVDEQILVRILSQEITGSRFCYDWSDPDEATIHYALNSLGYIASSGFITLPRVMISAKGEVTCLTN